MWGSQNSRKAVRQDELFRLFGRVGLLEEDADFALTERHRCMLKRESEENVSRARTRERASASRIRRRAIDRVSDAGERRLSFPGSSSGIYTARICSRWRIQSTLAREQNVRARKSPRGVVVGIGRKDVDLVETDSRTTSLRDHTPPPICSSHLPTTAVRLVPALDRVDETAWKAHAVALAGCDNRTRLIRCARR